MFKLTAAVLCAALIAVSAAQKKDFGDSVAPIKQPVVVIPTAAPAEPTKSVPTDAPAEPTKSVPTDAPAEPTKSVPTDAPAEPTKSVPTDAPAEPTKSVPTDAPAEPTKSVPTAAPAEPTKSVPTDAPTAAPTEAPTTVKPHCKPGDRKAKEGSCRDYEECDTTYKWIHKTCSTFCKVFEPVSSKCVWNWQFPCLKPSSTAAPPTQPITSPSGSPVTSSGSPVTSPTGSPVTPTEVPATSPSASPTTPSVAECTKQGSQKVFKKGDCKNYLECDSGKWVKKTCATGYDFDINKNECRWSWWAKC